MTIKGDSIWFFKIAANIQVPKCPYLHDNCPKALSPIVMSFERLENDHIVCAENNQRAHCRLKGKSAQSHTVINRTAVDLVSSTKFQRVQITDTLSWSLHTRAVARRAPDEERSLTLSYPYQFLQGYYRELTDMNICVVRGLQCRKSLQRGLKTAEKITESPLPGHCSETFSDQNKCFTVVSHPHHAPCLHLGEGFCRIHSRTAISSLPLLSGCH